VPIPSEMLKASIERPQYVRNEKEAVWPDGVSSLIPRGDGLTSY
jgi:hypothetical protein